MINFAEKQRQLNLLKWLTIALSLKLVFLNVYPYAFYVQQLLIYLAFMKSLSYFKGQSLVKKYIFIGIILLIANIVASNLLSITWHLVLTVSVDLLIILEFGKILVEIERQNNLLGSTARIMKQYMWIVLCVTASWTFLMNSEYDVIVSLLIVGAVLIFIVNVRLLFHLRSLKKNIKSKMRVVMNS
ncbi:MULTISPECIES: hypothetical protein [unclassified Lysinibacillus]|uniref:hypothetical protein n=1 Tax=unclassified Lysinibacillus TaxID=2636778 RepID=UPI002011DA8C|nr:MULTISPECIES: hypothetical protein [unclassified Lysinibacillus]MCL1694297.1 hypothetical protein [Lysinibacillus sp. BPa_S21]MCL1699086.1 hypothetical protein [Lysinibacillus sp. Bpr_S20]